MADLFAQALADLEGATEGGGIAVLPGPSEVEGDPLDGLEAEWRGREARLASDADSSAGDVGALRVGGVGEGRPGQSGGMPGPGDEERDKQAALMRRKRQAGREITIPAVVDPQRKARCRDSLLLFAETYFAQPPDSDRYPSKKGLAHLGFSEMHREILIAFESRIRYGGLQALAAPRGYGKDTLAIIAGIWAAVYGHTRFFVMACFKLDAAKKRLETIREQIETNKWLLEDFPEVCAPARALERAPQRGKQQTFEGEFTSIEWGETLIFPAIRGAACAGAIIAPASLNGSIRGLNIRGERPSFVAITDPQDRDISKSPQRVGEMIDLINNDFGGLGAHDEPLACLALMTIWERYDVAHRLTNRDSNPQWNGLTYRAVEDWPTRDDLWEEYEALMVSDRQAGDDTGRSANAFYLARRAEMDEGARVTWADGYIRKLASDGSPLESSALQHLMNLRFRFGDLFIETEMQNQPPDRGEQSHLTDELIASRLSEVAQFQLSEGFGGWLVQGIDVRARELHHVVLAVEKDWTASVVDYGITRIHGLPEGDYRKPDRQVAEALELCILEALRLRMRECEESVSPYVTSEGRRLGIDLTLIDSGWAVSQPAVYEACKMGGPRWRAAKGAQAGVAGSSKYVAPLGGKKVKGKKVGDYWYGQRQADGRTWLWTFGADHWKTFIHERFRQDSGTIGALTLYGSDPRAHRLFGRHLTAEEWDVEKGRWIKIRQYNHYFDCTAMAAVAASMMGARLFASPSTGPTRTEYSPREKPSHGTWKIGR